MPRASSTTRKTYSWLISKTALLATITSVLHTENAKSTTNLLKTSKKLWNGQFNEKKTSQSA